MALVKRQQLLDVLKVASVGLTGKAILEQSDHFIFRGGFLLTFNDSIAVRCRSPLDIEAAVPAADLLSLISTFPDEELKLVLEGNELCVTGKRRSAGLSVKKEIRLALDAIPSPEKWQDLGQDVPRMIQQAARTCGNDETLANTTVVHVTPDYVEACDNYRFFRATLPTGFNKNVKIPASALSAIGGHTLKSVSVGENWVHFRSTGGARFSVRAEHGSYHKELEKLFEVENGKKVELPSSLGEVLERAQVMGDVGYDVNVMVNIEDDQLRIRAQKDGGWYEEREKVEFSGRKLAFRVNPVFLREVVELTRKVECNQSRMKLKKDNQLFIVCLQAGERPASGETGDERKASNSEEE